MKRLNIKSLLILLFISAEAFSQSPDSLIAEALMNNPQLKALESRIQSKEYGSRSEGYLPPPTMGIEFSQINIEESNIWDNALSQNFFISQMFPLGGKLSAMENVQKENIRIAERDYEIFRNKLISDIRAAYYELWMIEHHAELKEEIVTLLNTLLKSAENSYVVNRSRYSDLLLIKAEIASNLTDITVLENEAEGYRVKLNSLVGREINEREIEVYHTWEIDTSAVNINDYKELLLVNNPSLKKMENMISMNQLEITANNKELIPDLMVQGMLMRMPRGMILTEAAPVHMLDGNAEVEYMYSIMASVTLPFVPWSSGKYSNKNQELEAGIRSIEYEKINMYREMSAELEAAIRQLHSSRAKVTLLEKEVIPLYKETLTSTISEFQNNISGISNIIETARMYLMKEEELAEAMTQHQMTLAEINQMTGVLK